MGVLAGSTGLWIRQNRQCVAVCDTNPLFGFVSSLSFSLPVFLTTLHLMGMHSVTQCTKEGLCWTKGQLLLPLSKLLADM